ncbi:MAG: type II toxin-antitoxin system RelE/ParE family toxin [Propionibacteriaceae bacterium]|nr:type II toxin-antitoxin system RelE/ParE family toxin [Propionibacteriaceae bacterium]
MQYTLETWGRRQRATYKARILHTLCELAQFPGLGRERTELGEDMRSFPVGQHLIVFRVSDKELIVTRIMHSRMDVEEQLDTSG